MQEVHMIIIIIIQRKNEINTITKINYNEY